MARPPQQDGGPQRPTPAGWCTTWGREGHTSPQDNTGLQMLSVHRAGSHKARSPNGTNANTRQKRGLSLRQKVSWELESWRSPFQMADGAAAERRQTLRTRNTPDGDRDRAETAWHACHTEGWPGWLPCVTNGEVIG